MLFFKSVLLFTAAVNAATLLPRSATDVLNSLKTIDADVKSLTSQITSWNGTAGGAGPILSSATKLDNDIKAATNTCNAQSVASVADSQTICNYVKNPLLPDIQALVSILQKRKGDADKSGLTNTVLSRLKTIRADTNTLINCLKSKAASSVASSCSTYGTQVLAAIDAAIKTYGG